MGDNNGPKEEEEPQEEPPKEPSKLREQLSVQIGPIKQRLVRAVSPWAEFLNRYWCDSFVFKRLVKRAFTEADLDASGNLSEAELYVCVLRVYELVNTYTATHVYAPKKPEVMALMKKHDLDKNGTLSYDEFYSCARTVFGISSFQYSVPLNVLVVISLRMFILPTTAKVLTATAGYVGGPLSALTWIPIAAYAVMMEIFLRYLYAVYAGV